MEIELVKYMSFDEYNERLYYESQKDNEIEISRRKFIKYLTIGSAGLLIPVYPQRKAEAFELSTVIALLGIAYLGLKIINEIIHLASHTKHDCTIELRNRGNKANKAMLDCYAYNKERKKSSYYISKETEEIPSYTFAIYTAKNLPEIEEPGRYRLGVKSGREHVKKEAIIT